MSRLAIWAALDGYRAEAASVDLLADGVRADGAQIAADPVPYRLHYRLDATGPGFATSSLEVEVWGEGWRRRLGLARDAYGTWTIEAEEDGAAALAAPGGDEERVTGALDCDLGLSAMTNLMPIRRHALHEQPAAHDFLMAWVSVPDLSVTPSQQRYEHVRRTSDGSVVRFIGTSEVFGEFTAELELDRDGLVRHYPELARRVEPGASA